MSDIRLQANLGGLHRWERKDNNLSGYTTVGRITKVNHKNHTADVVLTHSGDNLESSKESEGIHSCRIMERNAGYDKNLKVYYGDITPLHIGEHVLLLFTENSKMRPFILGSIHYTEALKNPMTTRFPITVEQEKEYYERLHITRMQDYDYLDGDGNSEKVHHSKAFLKLDSKELDDSRNGFKWDNLSVKNKTTKTTLESPYKEERFHPLNILASFQNAYSGTADLFKFFLSAKKGIFRILKDSASGKLSFFEVSEKGDIRVKRQVDSNIRDSGNCFAEIKVCEDTSIQITQKGASGTSKIILDTMGNINISTENCIEIKADKGVNISSKQAVNVNANSSINLNSPNINLNGNVNCPNC